jgi:hypothetical protein
MNGRRVKGRVPPEPFISWFVRLKEHKIPDFQRVAPRTDGAIAAGGGKGVGLSEKDVLKVRFDSEAFAVYCGITKVEYVSFMRRVRLWENGGGRKGDVVESLDMGFVDRVMTAVGRADLFQEWYGEYGLEPISDDEYAELVA